MTLLGMLKKSEQPCTFVVKRWLKKHEKMIKVDYGNMKHNLINELLEDLE